ncbi:MAG: GNAT family protein [Hyphomonadaceae bacterium]|nr:GNAT family protein [Hyphomonadaceae bacterium]
MAHTLLFGFDEQLAKWACARIPWADYQPTMKAVGVADGSEADAKLLAVCVYHSYLPVRMIDGKPWYGVCEISFAADSARWASRRTITNLLRIPFLQYNCRKVTTVIPSTNKRAIRFNEGIGLKPEGTLRHHFAKGVHACIHGMMKPEFEQRWLRPPSKVESRPNGQEGRISSLGP